MMESKSKKFDVTVSVISPHQEGDNDITDFRETIQKYVEQELEELGDVEIVDSKNAWDYSIEITFSLCYRQRENKPHLPEARILASFNDSKKYANSVYDSTLKYSKDQLCICCKNLVEFFNSGPLELARKDA